MKVTEVKLVKGGSNYTETPEVELKGGGGHGATARAYVGPNKDVTLIEVTEGGSGYKTAPKVVLTGGGSGKDAEGEAVIG